MPVPPVPLLLVDDEAPSVIVEPMVGESCAVTDTPAPAWMVEAGRLPVSKSMLATAALLTLFIATTIPSARFWPPFIPVPLPLVDAVLVFLTDDVIDALSNALTVSTPLAVTIVSSIVAVALEGFSRPKAFAIAGSPIRASMVLNRTFCAL